MSVTQSAALERRARVLGLIAMAALLLTGAAQNLFVDPDLWHEIGLIRDAARLGRVPLEDTLAYTPTVHPLVHHEWGTGAILYFVVTRAGATGLLLLRYGLVAAIAWACVRNARKRGASTPVLCSLLPIGIFLSWYGFSTVRAQMFSMLLTALLLGFFERDREGRRSWVLLWLPLHVVWLNLHGGFVAGVLLFGMHLVEQIARRRPVRHLVLVLLAMGALLWVNPYGTSYITYLGKALTLERSSIPEWAPIWSAPAIIPAIFAFSVCIALYAIWRAGTKNTAGVLVLAATAYAALRHQRHASLYAIVWISCVPSWIETTPLGAILRDLWKRRARTISIASAAITASCLVATFLHAPWTLTLPARTSDHAGLVYPVGAVEHLRTIGFRGNLMVRFNEGAFVAWKLNPDVKISMDGRYEVAYPAGALEENQEFFDAGPAWKEILAKYATDAVLAPAGKPIADELARLDGWSRIYRDDEYEVFARGRADLSQRDRRGEMPVGEIP